MNAHACFYTWGQIDERGLFKQKLMCSNCEVSETLDQKYVKYLNVIIATVGNSVRQKKH